LNKRTNIFQIIFPVDKDIQKSITEHLEPEECVWNTEDIYNNSLLVNPLIDLQKHYNCFVDKMLFPNLDKIKTNIIFTYTPMHGVGYRYIKNVFENAKFNVSILIEIIKSTKLVSNKFMSYICL